MQVIASAQTQAQARPRDEDPLPPTWRLEHFFAAC
jgi:hypothetical protein